MLFFSFLLIEKGIVVLLHTLFQRCHKKPSPFYFINKITTSHLWWLQECKWNKTHLYMLTNGNLIEIVRRLDIQSTIYTFMVLFCSVYTNTTSLVVTKMYVNDQIMYRWQFEYVIYRVQIYTIFIKEKTSFCMLLFSFHNYLIIMPICPIDTRHSRIWHPHRWLLRLSYFGWKIK